MKKIAILVFIVFGFGAATMAQTKDVKNDQRVLKNSIKDKKEDKHEAGSDLAHLRVEKAIQGRKEVRRHRRSIHKQGKHLERHGVKNPIHKAKVQAKAEKDAKNGKN